MFESRKKFVETDLKRLMSVKKDFAYIKYARAGLTDCEYMRIGDVQGRAVTLDITARSLGDIFDDVSRINLLGQENIAAPESVVHDADKLREISAYFKELIV